MPEQTTIQGSDDLNAAIAELAARGYRLDMIVPADSPTEARLSRDGQTIRLIRTATDAPLADKRDLWITGRAGMEYRDLIPDRLGGRLIASHIRLTKGGKVPDYVHYHKVGFQMIHCVAGAIRVVYDDQGPPFWLRPGDLVTQPPEIRHRVLEAQAGSEVVELGVPAIHETWVEHDIRLPTGKLDPERNFGGQRFVRHVASDAAWTDDGNGSVCRTAVKTATGGLADVSTLRLRPGDQIPLSSDRSHLFLYCLEGTIQVDDADGRAEVVRGSAIVSSSSVVVSASPADALVLAVALQNI